MGGFSYVDQVSYVASVVVEVAVAVRVFRACEVTVVVVNVLLFSVLSVSGLLGELPVLVAVGPFILGLVVPSIWRSGLVEGRLRCEVVEVTIVLEAEVEWLEAGDGPVGDRREGSEVAALVDGSRLEAPRVLGTNVHSGLEGGSLSHKTEVTCVLGIEQLIFDAGSGLEETMSPVNIQGVASPFAVTSSGHRSRLVFAGRCWWHNLDRWAARLRRRHVACGTGVARLAAEVLDLFLPQRGETDRSLVIDITSDFVNNRFFVAHGLAVITIARGGLVVPASAACSARVAFILYRGLVAW